MDDQSDIDLEREPDDAFTHRADRPDIERLLGEVRHELLSAVEKFGPIASPHEGYAVIQEEVDELWHEIKHGSRTSAYPEAVQVAAMAVRFLLDLYGDADG